MEICSKKVKEFFDFLKGSEDQVMSAELDFHGTVDFMAPLLEGALFVYFFTYGLYY